jgi:hypothetical protein
MLSKTKAMVAASAAVLVAVAGDRAASASDLNWVPDYFGNVGFDAVAGGIDADQKTLLYFCRAFLSPGYQPGKVSSKLGTCNYPYGGEERKDQQYEIMVPHWESASYGQLAGSPYPAGTDSDGAPLYFCRASFRLGLQPGKLKPGAGCYIAYAGNEILLKYYQVLQNDLPMTLDPNGAFPIYGGYETNQAAYLGLCVANYNGSKQPGKLLVDSDDECHFPYAGVEILTGDYSLLISHIVYPTQSPAFSFVTGQDTNGQPLYSCTADFTFQGITSVQLGKYRRDLGCHVSYGGREWGVADRDAGLVDGFAQ